MSTIGGVEVRNAVLDNVAHYPAALARTSGNVATATALAASGTTCTATQAATGVNASGNAVGCWTPSASLNNTTMDNTNITKGLIDNATFGSVTPIIAITSLAGTFTSLSVGGVDNTEIGYLNGATSNLQAQIDLKAPKASPAFTGNATFDNEVTAVQFNSSGADGTHFINVLNQAAVSDVTRGNCYLDNTTLAWNCSNGSAYSAYAGTVTPSTTDTFTNKTYDAGATGNSFKIVSSANPTVSAAGQIAIDTTANQVLAYGGALTVLDPVHQYTYTNFGAALNDNTILTYFDRAVTINKIVCLSEGSTSGTTWHMYHNTNRQAAGNAVVTAATACNSATTGTTTTSFNDATIPAGSWLWVYLDTLSADNVSWTVFYTVDRQ